jgi:hypothetical protein
MKYNMFVKYHTYVSTRYWKDFLAKLVRILGIVGLINLGSKSDAIADSFVGSAILQYLTATTSPLL